MNLRSFHFFLILLSAILAIVLGGWLLHVYGRERDVMAAVGAVASFVVAVGLILYDRWFLQKTRAFK